MSTFASLEQVREEIIQSLESGAFNSGGHDELSKKYGNMRIDDAIQSLIDDDLVIGYQGFFEFKTPNPF